MSSYQEKLSLLSEMIAFAQIDGEVHEREYRFLSVVATQLKVDVTDFERLFVHKAEKIVIKSEHQRIMQFYRLALLMHADGVLHENEQIAIRELGVNMGLSPFAMRSVLAEMEKSPGGLIDPDILIALFRAQHN